jgi:hypothetical protein
VLCGDYKTLAPTGTVASPTLFRSAVVGRVRVLLGAFGQAWRSLASLAGEAAHRRQPGVQERAHAADPADLLQRGV